MKSNQMLTFKLLDNEYAINIDYVTSIQEYKHITRVPGSPSFIKGVMNLRGAVTPIIDLKRRMNLGEFQADSEPNIIVALLDDICIGLMVDEVKEVIEVPKDRIDQTIISDGEEGGFFEGLARIEGRVIMAVNLQSLLLQNYAGSPPYV
ncbi:chemotaxis protein CheW [Bacillus infantis]|uniref:chemotaxis protein CheW n=1 Tax=Bacillus infantis TaxID=324767 RepID=UPI003CF4187A